MESNGKYYAVCIDDRAYLTTIETDQPDALNYIRKQRDKWAKLYTGKAQITVKLLARRPNCEQVSWFGSTPAQGAKEVGDVK